MRNSARSCAICDHYLQAAARAVKDSLASMGGARDARAVMAAKQVAQRRLPAALCTRRRVMCLFAGHEKHCEVGFNRPLCGQGALCLRCSAARAICSPPAGVCRRRVELKRSALRLRRPLSYPSAIVTSSSIVGPCRLLAVLLRQRCSLRVCGVSTAAAAASAIPLPQKSSVILSQRRQRNCNP
jgi:hypothetical protein